MVLNDAGRMVEKWVGELRNKFEDIRCDDSIVMPNHFHAIIQNVGADLRVCPNPDVRPDPCVCPHNEPTESTRANCIPCESPSNEHASGETTPGEHAQGEHIMNEHTRGERTTGEHIGSPLHVVVQWFKTMTTNEYIRGVKQFNWTRFHVKLWQRNYSEHIIRN